MSFERKIPNREKFNTDTQTFTYEGDVNLLNQTFKDIILKYLKRVHLLSNLIEQPSELENLLKEINDTMGKINREKQSEKQTSELTMGKLKFLLKAYKDEPSLSAMQ